MAARWRVDIAIVETMTVNFGLNKDDCHIKGLSFFDYITQASVIWQFCALIIPSMPELSQTLTYACGWPAWPARR